MLVAVIGFFLRKGKEYECKAERSFDGPLSVKIGTVIYA